jgi:predicted Ser/Thr protein kinase
VETTGTAPASAKPGGPVGSIGAMLGRYRLEHELGAGAMGVVYAAFDADLERRIALKVLRVVAPTPEAKDRLLREARAMARLSHPNVVTVYEVGTANGRDFVAMELIRGEPLVDWLRATRRTPDAIIDAFLAAGRGLAAAHAAGIVHRDFKPHNVLRSRDGRVAVTDFGLAREAGGDAAAALDVTLPPGAQLSATASPSPLAALTSTGTLLGTPAYMAPEQWSGGTVSQATDQFAYCVALWEALAGERPYLGASREQLRSQVTQGPAGLDASRLPRRVRGFLRRGLDPDPARRWPSMEALLAQLARANRRPAVAAAIAGGAIVAAIAVVVAMRAGDPPAAACEVPARDVTAVWSPAIAAEVRTKTSDAHAAVLDAAHRSWQAARARACAAPSNVRHAQLSCLDGVLERFDALRAAYARVPEAPAEELQAQLIDPAVCTKPAATEIPRLALASTPSVTAAYELYARSATDHPPADAEIAAFIAEPRTDPCARVIAILAFGAASRDVPRKRAMMASATAADAQCNDERVHTDLLLQDIPYHSELPVIGPRGEAAIAQAQAAAAHVMQPDLAAALAMHRALVAHQRGQWDEALRLVEAELAGYRARGLQVGQLRAVILRNYLRLERDEPADLDAIASDVPTWRSLALAGHQPELARQLDVLAAKARFRRGDVSGAHPELIRLWQAQPRVARTSAGRKIIGEVVDGRGRPVAGATIAASTALTADSVGIGVPALAFYDGFRDRDLRTATSDGTGHFVLEDAAPAGAIAAQLGDRRSEPLAIADHVTLVLEPTRRISGTVDLGPMSHTHVGVGCTSARDRSGWFLLIAPVAPDGSFAIAGATIGALRLSVSIQDSRPYDGDIEFQALAPARDASTGIRLRVTPSSSRTLDVIVRSTVTAPVEGARVGLIAGVHSFGTVADLARANAQGVQTNLATPVVGQPVPAPVLDKLRPGDLVAHFEHVRPGDMTVCAGGFAGDPLDPDDYQRSAAHLSQLVVKCKHIGPGDALVEIAVPPQARLD